VTAQDLDPGLSTSPDDDQPDNGSREDSPDQSPAVDQHVAAAPAVSARWQWTIAACTSAAFVALVRWVVSFGRDEYAIWPDEPAQLAMARYLGGGTPWNMHNHSIWRPGYAALLSPIHWFTDDPVTVLHAGFALNAVLGGVSAALMVFVARRLTPMGPTACAGAAILVSCAPSLLFTTNFLWSESLIGPLFLANLIALMRLRHAPSLGRAFAAGGLAAASFATHSRMLPLAAITVGVIALAHRSRLGTAKAAIAIGATVAGVVAAAAGSRAVVSQLWNQSSNINSADAVASRATDIGPLLMSLAGQSWYLLVSSVGVVGFGVVALARSAWDVDSPGCFRRLGWFRRDTPDGKTPIEANPRSELDRERPDAARLVLVVVGACVALSVVFMAGRTRTDQVIYGRYNDAVMAPILLAGLWSLFAEANRRRLVITATSIAAGVLVTTAMLLGWRSTQLDVDDGLEPMILGLQPFIRSETTVRALDIAAAALVISAAVVASAVFSARRRSVALSTVLVALVVAGTISTRTVINREWDDRGDYSAVEAIQDGVLADAEPVDYFLPRGSNSTNRLMLYQMYLPRHEFVVIDDVLDQVSSPMVFAPERDPELLAAGAVLVWADPDHPFGLWQRAVGT
jgi:hypothetical protein